MLTMKRMSILVGVLVIACTAYVAHVSLLDGIDGTLLSALLGDDTVYAEGYSDAKFRQVVLGSSQEEVFSILGPPLETGVHNGESILRYARSAHDSNYHVRVIVLRDGRVSEKLHEFYVD